MAESFNLLRRVRSLDIAPELMGYSGVVIFAGQDEDGNNIEYRAGDQTGTVLEITNEWGSQAQADAIYRKIRGYKYKPYRATGSQLDPSSEIGDAVTVNDTYGGVFAKVSTYGKHISTDIEAPSNDEIEHEFQIQYPTNRQYERFTRSARASLSITASKIAAEVSDRKSAVTELKSSLNIQAGQINAEVSAREKDVSELRASVKVNTDKISAEISARTKDVSDLRASLNIQAGQISAKVSKSGGSSASFAWDMQPEYMSFVSNGSEVLRLDKTGAEIKGIVRATGGKIGGFDIQANYLSYNGQTWGGTNTIGAYIGQSGIQLGNNFKVDMQGNLSASSGTFSGNVYAGNIQHGGSAGYMSGGGISAGSIYGDRLAENTITTAYTSSGINSSLGYADFANGVFNGWNKAPYLYVGYLHIVNAMYYGEYTVKPKSYSFKDADGNQVTLYYMAWSRT